MKFLVVFVVAALAISAQALSDEEKLKLKEFIGECSTSTGVDRELIGKARSHEYTGRDPKLAAYYSCVMGKMHFQAPDGSFNTDLMVEKLPVNASKEVATKAVKKCAVFDASLSNDDNSMNFIYCFYKTVGKDFKLV